MKYEKPNMELVELETVDIITGSAGRVEESKDSEGPEIVPPDEW